MTLWKYIAVASIAAELGILATVVYISPGNFVSKHAVVQSAPKEWEQHTFTCNNQLMNTSSGETHFYPTKLIDDWVKRLNKVLN